MTTITPGSLLRWPGRAVGACLIGAIRALPGHAQPTPGPGMPVRAELQPLHGRIDQEVRHLERTRPRLTPGVALPPLEPRRLRPAVTGKDRACDVTHCARFFLITRNSIEAASRSGYWTSACRPHIRNFVRARTHCCD